MAQEQFPDQTPKEETAVFVRAEISNSSHDGIKDQPSDALSELRDLMAESRQTHAFLGPMVVNKGLKTVRRRMNGERNNADRRFRFIPSIGRAAFLGAGLGVVSLFTGLFGVETVPFTGLGKATVTKIDLDVNKTSVIGYETNIDHSMVGYAVQPSVDLPFVQKLKLPTSIAKFGLSRYWTFEGTVNEEICMDARKEQGTYDKKKGEVSLTIPLDALEICSSTKVETRKFSHRSGLGNTIIPVQQATELVRALYLDKLPVLHQAVDGQDKLDSYLQNLSEIQAQQQGANQCVDGIWQSKKVRDAFRADVAKNLLTGLSMADPRFTAENVTDKVHVYIGDENAANPDDPTQKLSKLKTNNSELIAKIKKQKGMDLSAAIDKKNGSYCIVPDNVETVH